MRIGRSYLKSHSFAINLSSSDNCICGAIDDNKHILLFCFMFQEERLTMMSKINLFFYKFSFSHNIQASFFLLDGINLDSVLLDHWNRLILFPVQEFIPQTKRSSNHLMNHSSLFFFFFLSFSFFLLLSFVSPCFLFFSSCHVIFHNPLFSFFHCSPLPPPKKKQTPLLPFSHYTDHWVYFILCKLSSSNPNL